MSYHVHAEIDPCMDLLRAMVRSAQREDRKTGGTHETRLCAEVLAWLFDGIASDRMDEALASLWTRTAS